MNTSIVPGSLGAITRQTGGSLAESFLSAEVIIVVDVSGSMAARDSRGGNSRYSVACEELTKLQTDLPGKLAVVGFSSTVQFVPGGLPVFEGGGTNLAAALRFVQPADGTVRYVVISDGEPSDEQAALAIARQFTSRLDTVFVGPPDERHGREFLVRLAAAAGGRSVTADRAQELADKVQTLLLAGGR